MGRTKRGSLPQLVHGRDGRWSVNVRTSTGGRWKVQLGSGLTDDEARHRHRLVCQDLDRSNRLPAAWEPPWRTTDAIPRPTGAATWAALLDAVRRRDVRHQRNTDSAAIAAAEPHLPARVTHTEPRHLDRMLDAWHETLARRTQLKYFRVIRAALAEAEARGLIEPERRALLLCALAPRTPLPVVRHAERVAAPDAVEAVLPALNEPWRTLALLLLLTGARPSELLAAVPGDLDTDASGSRWLVPGRHKNRHRGKDRRIPLVDRALEMVEARADGKLPGELLFPSRAGTQIHHTSLTNAIKRACVKVGVEPFSAYKIRHLAVTTTLHRQGLLPASRLAGHATPQTTLSVYAHALDPDGIAAADSLGDAFRGIADRTAAGDAT